MGPDVEAGEGARTRRWGLAWVGELGRWNRSAMRELAGELREIREAGELERKKKFEEERRKKRSWREREREKERNILMREEREV